MTPLPSSVTPYLSVDEKVATDFARSDFDQAQLMILKVYGKDELAILLGLSLSMTVKYLKKWDP